MRKPFRHNDGLPEPSPKTTKGTLVMCKLAVVLSGDRGIKLGKAGKTESVSARMWNAAIYSSPSNGPFGGEDSTARNVLAALAAWGGRTGAFNQYSYGLMKN